MNEDEDCNLYCSDEDVVTAGSRQITDNNNPLIQEVIVCRGHCATLLSTCRDMQL